MINEKLTFQKFGYHSYDWAPKATKRVMADCDKCGQTREISKDTYRALCRSCAKKGKSKPIGFAEKRRKIMLGTVFSIETKRKIKESKTGVPRATPWLTNKPSHFKGHKHSQTTKELMSEHNFMKTKHGKEHPCWTGGFSLLSESIRKAPETLLWRKTILERDKHTCQICGNTKSLESHHIKNFVIIFNEFLQEYSQLNLIEDKEILLEHARKYAPFWDIKNGQTVCLKCHIEFK